MKNYELYAESYKNGHLGGMSFTAKSNEKAKEKAKQVLKVALDDISSYSDKVRVKLYSRETGKLVYISAFKR